MKSNTFDTYKTPKAKHKDSSAYYTVELNDGSNNLYKHNNFKREEPTYKIQLTQSNSRSMEKPAKLVAVPNYYEYVDYKLKVPKNTYLY